MKELNLSEYIRYFVIGLVSVFVHGLFVKGTSLPSGLEIAGIALVVGFVVYGVHRAVLYPLVNSVVLTLLHAATHRRYGRKGWYIQFLIVTEKCLAYDTLRWERFETLPAIRNLKEWAHQIHFLYCLCWILLVYSAVLSPVLGYTVEHGGLWLLAALGFGLSALVHQTRCQLYEMRLMYVEAAKPQAAAAP